MDVLSDILDALKLEGTLFFRSELEPPWGIEVPVEGKKAILHIIAQGCCHLRMEEADKPLDLRTGDLVLVSQARHHRHKLFDALDSPHNTAKEDDGSIICGIDQCETVTGPADLPASPTLTAPPAAPADKTVLICGYFDFDEEIIHPLLRFLPMCMQVPTRNQANLHWLEYTIHLIQQEAFSKRSGADAMANRMAEILFIKALRIFIEENMDEVCGLAAMNDRHIGRALTLIHTQFAQNLDLPLLAKEAGLSRSAFAQRFNKLMGMPAAQYLTQWRLQKAKTLLAQGQYTILDVAGQVGYQTESAFNKVFKKHFGVTPGAYRCKAALKTFHGYL